MADQRFTCPNCGSDNIVRFSVAYKNGAADIDTKTNTTGVGFAGGHFGIGGASGHTTGTQLTQLAQEVAPPKKVGYLVPFITAVIAGIVVGIVAESITGSSTLSYLGWVAFLAVLYVFGYKRVYHYNKFVYPEQMANWQKSWICMKCGHKFIL